MFEGMSGHEWGGGGDAIGYLAMYLILKSWDGDVKLQRYNKHPNHVPRKVVMCIVLQWMDL